MVKLYKKYKESIEKVESDKKYNLDEALSVLDTFAKAKFDETVEVAINLGVDPKKSDQMIRGSISLPHGLGKTVKVVVFAKGEKAEEAKTSGADFVGADDLVEKIKGGWLGFDKAIATPDMMGTVSKIGKILGPRGMMPNPKVGTVSMEVGKVVKEIKAGKVEYRVEKGGIVHAPIGKRSFGSQKLKENFKTLMNAVIKAKPAASKGLYVKNVAISATMTPGVKIDAAMFR